MSVGLYLLESKNWYYFDLIPKFDEELSTFMNSCSESKFIRINITDKESYLIVPVKHFSTTGVHHIGEEVGYREKKMGEVVKISAEEAYRFITSLVYGGNTIIENPEEAYIKYFSEEFDESFDKGHKMTESIDSFIDSVKGSAIFNFFGYENENLLDFVSKNIALESNYDKKAAIIQWFSEYTHSLLKTAVGKYIEEGIIYNSNIEHTFINTAGEKVNVSFDEYITNGSAIRREKVESFIRTHVVYYNLYPVLRHLAYLGSIEEEILYQIVDTEIDSLQEVYGDAMNFIYETLEARLFLKQAHSVNEDIWKEYIRQHNFLINPKHYSKKLIKPDYGEILHKRYFNNGTLEITLRAFNPETDMEFLHEWSNMDYAKQYWEMDVDKQEFEEAYIKHMGVDYSHPYIGLLNGNPIFTLELYWAVKDEVGKYYRFNPGDYGFHMLIAPAKEKIPNFSMNALAMCMEYFFSFPQLTRMIGEASASHKGTHNLITKVGCEFNRSLALPYKTSNLTFLDREKFYETTEDIFKNSVLKINITT
ncbi:GNAT family N-acetyltransferase [Chryseobacterium jejuense]|uniref:Acetyltransferase (GNAT) domain-containing protein n=1 Tax=Chryseobacterium jejuense TaxID=445960 RepID=A0A2X2WJT4_CHRJE|nr:GNAT family N-acetyltransferase [Chryseobacterium jejuense]SDJ81823.1 Acetyltransferase (GNAT) domain-containing protein [Chryseobacterium jejuense]SQB43632.1 N(6)-hydroxylysine O-acetyltransferase [Chryseobacterium jejuense]